MSMTGDGLGAMIKSEVINAFGSARDDVELTAYCNALGRAIVEYIQANALVTVQNVTSGTESANGTVA